MKDVTYIYHFHQIIHNNVKPKSFIYPSVKLEHDRIHRNSVTVPEPLGSHLIEGESPHYTGGHFEYL